MKIELTDAIEKICNRYGKYGIDEECAMKIVCHGLNAGLNVTTSYNIARAALGNQFGENETYDIDDYLDAMGVEQEEPQIDDVWGNLQMTFSVDE